MGVPAVMVVRHPLDACVSLSIYQGARDGALLGRWHQFHCAVLAVPEATIVRFEHLTEDSDRTLARVLSMARASPVPGPDRLESLGDVQINERIDRMAMSRFGVVDPLTVSRPTSERENLKSMARRRLENEHAGSLSDCRTLYDELVARAEP